MVDTVIKQYTNTAYVKSTHAVKGPEVAQSRAHDEGVLVTQDTTCLNVPLVELLQSDDHAGLDAPNKLLVKSGSKYQLQKDVKKIQCIGCQSLVPT